MTQPLHSSVSRPANDRVEDPVARAERIAAELAALGEAPADDEELAFAATATDTAAHDDVRTIATLVALSSWAAPAQGLLPLERHRVWQRIAARASASPAMLPIAPAANHSAHSVRGSAHSVRGSAHSVQGSAHSVQGSAQGAAGFRGVLASLALVASVALLLRLDVAPPPSAEDRAALASMGEATRAVLEGTLPGEQDGPRARALAEGYAERLQATRGAAR